MIITLCFLSKITKKTTRVGPSTSEHIKILNNVKINNKIKETDWTEVMYRAEKSNYLALKIYLQFCDIYNKSRKLLKISKKNTTKPMDK